MSHCSKIWESHSPQSVEIDTGSMLEHSGTDAFWCSLLVFGMVVQQHHRLDSQLLPYDLE
jgi:hypothetical protein